MPVSIQSNIHSTIAFDAMSNMSLEVPHLSWMYRSRSDDSQQDECHLSMSITITDIQ